MTSVPRATDATQLGFSGDARNVVTSDDAPETVGAPEMAQFDCPRCGERDVTERFYGPCSACRAQLRAGAQPPAPAAPLRAPGRPWAVIDGGPAPAHLGQLAEVAQQLEVDQLWLTPAALEVWGLPAQLGTLRAGAGEPHAFHQGAVDAGWTSRPDGLAPWATLWREGDGRRGGTVVSVPSWGPRRDPWRDVAARDLERGLGRFLELVGVPWYRSGAITSDGLIRELHKGRRGLRLEPTELPIAGEIEDPFWWHRTPAPARWLHAFDLNGQHLSAASSLALPVGKPQHVAGPVAIDAKTPGLWRLEIPERDDAWPDVFRPRAIGRQRASSSWATTPVAALAGEQGHQALEAWIWPQHHRFLEPWYKRLRDARTELGASELAADVAALRAVKAVYREGVGRLSSTKRTRTDDPLYQPLWRALVIGMARARLWRRIAQLEQPPCAVNVDALWFASDVADPHQLALELGLPMGDGLGQFRHHATVAGDVGRQVLEAGGPRVFLELEDAAQ